MPTAGIIKEWCPTGRSFRIDLNPRHKHLRVLEYDAAGNILPGPGPVYDSIRNYLADDPRGSKLLGWSMIQMFDEYLVNPQAVVRGLRI